MSVIEVPVHQFIGEHDLIQEIEYVKSNKGVWRKNPKVDIIEFFTWLFMLQYQTPEISIVGDITVRFLTFAVSYTLVGLIFTSLGWFNSKVMSLVYFIISTLLGFVLAYIVMLIETHLLVIGITLGVILLLAVGVWIAIAVKNKNN